VTRGSSLKRLWLFLGVVATAAAVLYLPTLSGGAPWSWFIAEAPPLVWFVAGLVIGLLVSHWTWPATERWPELEREVAAEPVLPCDDCREWRRRLRTLVRPHVLKREGRR